jgi:hypothetical protein
MQLYNKTILLSNLQSLYELLNNNSNESLYNCKCIYKDRIAIKHFIRNGTNIIQIWKTKSLFDYWYDDYSISNFIACIDYNINDTYIKINHLGMNDTYLDEYISEDLVKNIVNFIKIVANKENKLKIILDVHENLKMYLKYYYYIGFKPNNNKCKNNPYWIETELIC